MSSTRDFKSPGIFAESATTVIPPTPIAGVAYRDSVNGTDDVPNGWRYGTRVESQDWNQIMFLITSLLAQIDKKGVLGWSNEVVYDEACIAFGSDEALYKWLQESGPGTAAGVRDPISEPLYWSVVPLNALADSAEMAAGVITDKAPSVAAVMSLFSKRVFAQNDFIRIPDVPGGLILQFGIANITTSATGGTSTVSFPTAFPNACRFICGNYRNNGVISDCFAVNTWVISNSQFTITLDPPGSGPSPTGAQTAFWFAGGY